MVISDDRKTRIWETFWLFWGFQLVGFINGIIGPTVLDLQLLSGSSMIQMTYIFFLQGAGFIAGILLAALLEKVATMRLIMTSSLLVGCLTNFALPWGTVFYYLAVMFFLLGLAKGLVDFAALSICNLLWAENKSFPFQFVTLGAGIGAFVAPFLATPFLAPTDTKVSLFMLNSNFTPTSPCLQTDCKVQSRVQYVYVIIGIICLPAVVATAHYYRKRTAEPLLSYEQFSNMEPVNYTLRENLFIVLVFLIHIPVSGVCLAYSDLLVVYGLTIPLHVLKSRLTVMISIFWGTFLAGRVINFLFSKYLPTVVLLLLNFMGMAVACCVLSVFGQSEEVALWIGSAALGVFVSPFLPMIMTWTADYIPLSSRTFLAGLTASGIGEILVPFLAGQCVAYFGPQYLMYFISGAGVYLILLFASLVIYGRRIKRN